KGELAVIGAGTVGQHVTLLHSLPLEHDRLLADAGVLVRALELGELIDIGADFTRHLPFVSVAFHANNDAFGVDRVHNASALTDDDRTGISRSDALHSSSDVRRFGTQQ